MAGATIPVSRLSGVDLGDAHGVSYFTDSSVVSCVSLWLLGVLSLGSKEFSGETGGTNSKVPLVAGSLRS